MEIKVLDPIKDNDLLYKIVEIEDRIFGAASIGNYNIKPMAKYGRVYVIIEDEIIVSIIEVMSSFDRKLAYIYGLLTESDYQNKGYAHKLLDFCIKDLKNMEIKKVQLTTGIENYKAIKLYKDFGFYVKEILEDEYKDGEKRYLFELNI